MNKPTLKISVECDTEEALEKINEVVKKTQDAAALADELASTLKSLSLEIGIKQ